MIRPSVSKRARVLVVASAAWGLLGAPAFAQQVPRRQVPPAVLVELAEVERRFEAALAADCHVGTCFAKGCAYGDHAVVDRPAGRSMPGIGDDQGPGSVAPQEFLTKASCAFAYEPTLVVADAEALARRLQLKVSGGFVSVSVSRQELPPIPPALRELPVEPPPPPAAPPPEPPPWTVGYALRELWAQLLPHAWWMVAIGLLTVASLLLLWAWRRLGQPSIDEQAMLAQLLRDDAAPPPPAEEPRGDDADAAYVAQQAAQWRLRLAAAGPDRPDPELEALVRALLVARDLPLLAKATLTFSDRFLDAFPAGGEVAAAKLELADYLQSADLDALPDDASFYRALDRKARAAALASQPDAELVRGLRDAFGPSGLVALLEQLPARAAALLLALAPLDVRAEVSGLLTPVARAQLAGALLRSNRMHPDEAHYVVEVLRAARAGRPLPAEPALPEGEHGAPFDAAGPVSGLLAGLSPEVRAKLFTDAVAEHRGSLPRWQRAIVYADLLRALPREARADALLGVEAEALGAWLAQQDAAARDALRDGLPRSLLVALDSGAELPRARALALAEDARRQLAEGLQRQLAATGQPFEQLVTGAGARA